MYKVLVVDDHSLIRKGIIYMLSADPNLSVTAEAESAEKALELIRMQPFDLVIMDIVMPGRGGLEVLKEIREQQESIRIVILSMYREAQLVLRCYREGAHAYVNKSDSDALLLQAIHTVLAGRRFLTAQAGEYFIDYISAGGESLPHLNLTNREIQVLIRIGRGKTVREISDEMSLSPKTVYAHRYRIMEKMHFQTTTDIIKYVVDNNLLIDH